MLLWWSKWSNWRLGDIRNYSYSLWLHRLADWFRDQIESLRKNCFPPIAMQWWQSTRFFLCETIFNESLVLDEVWDSLIYHQTTLAFSGSLEWLNQLLTHSFPVLEIQLKIFSLAYEQELAHFIHDWSSQMIRLLTNFLFIRLSYLINGEINDSYARIWGQTGYLLDIHMRPCRI